MKAVLNRLARMKGLDASIPLAEWRGVETLVLLRTLLVRRLRGWGLRLRGARLGPGALCGARVGLIHGRHLSAGRALNIESDCEIVALSRRGLRFGDRCTIGRGAVIRPTNVLLDEVGEGMRVGSHSNIGVQAFIGCSGWIEIGERVMMGPGVRLLAENHVVTRTDVPIKEQGVHREFVCIEDDCWLGAGATVLAGVTVGRGSVVAAGAVVTRDVPPGSIVGGVPARLLRTRDPGADPDE